MTLIEPCCAPKHVSALIDRIGEGGTAMWHGYGDLSLSELLPAILQRYSETELLLVAPRLPDVAAEAVARCMRRQRMRADGLGKMHYVGHMTLVTDLTEKKSPAASLWLKDNPFGDRLSLRNVQQNDTAIVLPDIAFVGNMNMAYGGHFTAMATKNARTVDALRSIYLRLTR